MARPSLTRAPKQLLSQWGEPRPLPGLAASAAQTLPRPLLFALALLYAWSGLFGHDPWRGDDLLGVALARSAFIALSSGEGLFWVPSLSGLITSDQAPLPALLTALLLWPIDLFARLLSGAPLSTHQFDDLARSTLAIGLAVGLYGLWRAVERLAMRREARPVDPLGIGPTAPALGRTLGDCAVLLALACLGGMARWHEAGGAALSFAIQAWLLWALATAPEHPHRAGRLSAPLLLGLFLTDGLSALVGWGLGLSLTLGLVHAWRLVAAPFLRQLALYGSLSLGLLLLCLWQSGEVTAAGQWLTGQLQTRPQWPWAAAKTWAWTWWPVWPIVLALLVQALRHGLWHLDHLRMLGLLSLALLITSLIGLGQVEAGRLLPLAPLVGLAIFGLLSLPRPLVSLLDWFAVVVFTALASLIWLYWSAMVSGFPAQLSTRLDFFAPGLSRETFGPVAFLVGVGVSGAWLALVTWRIRRAEARLWRPVVLSAGGVSLVWLLMLSLWGPALEIHRGYRQVSDSLSGVIASAKQAQPAAFSAADCIQADLHDRTSRSLILAYGLGRLGQPGEHCPLRLEFQDRFVTKAADDASAVLITQSRIASRPNREVFQLAWSGSLKKQSR